MLCQRCSENEATVHIQEILGSQQTLLNLCAQCAAEHEMAGVLPDGLQLDALVLKLTGQSLAKLPVPAAAEAAEEPAGACGCCGLTHSEFRRTGRLGCETCYVSFEEWLLPELSKMHRGTSHCGKQPGQPAACEPSVGAKDPIAPASQSRLQAELARAVAAEQYERAAELRDLLKHPQSGGEVVCP